MNKDITITKEQSALAFNFLEALFSGDVDAFWKNVSKVDQARIYGMYRAYKMQEHSQDISFLDYVSDYIMPDVEKQYEGLRDNNPGIASHTRNTSEGEMIVLMLPNVKVSRTYIAETQVLAYPIHMTIDANYKNGEIIVEWKIRIYVDQDYKYLK